MKTSNAASLMGKLSQASRKRTSDEMRRIAMIGIEKRKRARIEQDNSESLLNSNVN
jgi:hypothetical protein